MLLDPEQVKSVIKLKWYKDKICYVQSMLFRHEICSEYPCDSICRRLSVHNIGAGYDTIVR